MNSPAKQNPQGWPVLAYLGLLWLWVASSCWKEWHGSDYSYGWLVIPLAGYFAFRRLGACPAQTAAPFFASLARMGMLLPAIAALPLELLRLAPLYWRGTAWAIFLVAAIASVSLAYLAGGARWFKASLFSVVFASLAVPWPTFFEQAVSLRLMAMMADIVSELLRLSGVPAEREGMVIILPNCAVGIEEACSGLRSLQASVMLALAAGELANLNLFRRIVLLIVAPYLALMTNLGRTLGLAAAGLHQGAEGVSRWHGPSGTIALLVLALLVAALAWLFRRPPGPVSAGNGFVPPGRLAPLAGGLTLVALAAAHGWYAFHKTDASTEPLLAIANPGAENITSLPAAMQMLSILAPDEGQYLREQDPEFGTVTGYHFFWRSSRETINQVYHRPDVCMPGAGWQSLAEPEEFSVELGGRPVQWHLLRYERKGLRADLLWGAWLDGRPVQFALGRSASVQAQLLWQLIRSGQQDATYEVAAVLVPRQGAPLTTAQAAEILQRTFSLRENSPRR